MADDGMVVVVATEKTRADGDILNRVVRHHGGSDGLFTEFPKPVIIGDDTVVLTQAAAEMRAELDKPSNATHFTFGGVLMSRDDVVRAVEMAEADNDGGLVIMLLRRDDKVSITGFRLEA